MAFDLDFVKYLVDQMSDAGEVAYRPMFGGCTIYCDGKVVALVCDSQLFVKPTGAGKAFIGQVVEAPPYEGAKNCFLIEDQVENGEWFSQLIRLTAAELPKPKPRKKRKNAK